MSAIPTIVAKPQGKANRKPLERVKPPLNGKVKPQTETIAALFKRKDKATTKVAVKGKTTTPAKVVVKAAKPRDGFFLTDDEIVKFKTEYKATKTMPIPHHRGNYQAIIQSLLNLGANKPHGFDAMRKEIVSVMSDPETKDDNGKTLWQRFNGKEAKSEDNAKKTNEKIHQNCEVLQRLGGETPYGLRLMQIGQKVLKSKGVCIDILRGLADKTLYRLNLNSAKPQHDFKRQRSA